MRKDIKIVLESIWYLILPVFIFVLKILAWVSSESWLVLNSPVVYRSRICLERCTVL